MNKNVFTRLIKKQFEGLSLEKQIGILQAMQESWIVELLHAKQQEAGIWVPDDKKNQYILCKACKRYYLKSENKSRWEREIKTEYTHTDGGYGDDDRIGEIEYLVEYKTCPRCKSDNQASRTYLRKIREWRCRN